MRNTTWWVAGLLALSALGCAGGTAPTSTPTSDLDGSPAAASIGELGSLYQQGDLVQGAVAVYTLNIDPSTLSATSQLKAIRGAQANDDLYLLPIDGFFTAKSFRLTSVSSTATTVDVGYSITHPFPAPNNPTGPSNGSTNRSDLGVAGMVLLLADATGPGNTYFTDRIANTSLVTNADAYFSPGGMITTTGLTANTFPYKQLVDESGSTGSREGISNGGNPSGNFGTDGWTRAEYGAGNNGWTGMGVLHGGQTSLSSLSLDKTALGASDFSLDIAVIAKYNDPRGGTTGAQKRSHRLPPATADATQFAYRGPHCALDVSQIEFVGESGGFIADNISASTLRFRVTDFDARATESAQADLSLDPSFTNVAIGEAGVPDLSVSIPGVLGATDDWDPGTDLDDDDSGFGGDAGLDSGAPGDGLFYSKTVSKGIATGQPNGDITGLVRATDVEAAAPLWVVLNGSLAPATNPPVPVTYQAFTVFQLPGNLLPTGNWSVSPTTITSGGTTNVSVTNVVDSDSPTFNVQVDWGTGGGFVTVGTGLTPGPGPFGPFVSPVYTLVNPLVAESKTLAVRLVDGVSAATNLATNVGGTLLTVNPAPTCTTPPNMSTVNLTIATLTTGGVLRSGAAADQVITGFRLTWTDGPQGPQFYSIQRAPWAAGVALPAPGAYVQITEIADGAGVNTYDHIPAAADLQANRWIYRIVGRCTSAGADGVPSELAVAAVLNFEGLALGTGANALNAGGWVVNMDEPTYGSSHISFSATDALGGGRSLEFDYLYDAFNPGVVAWCALTSPATQLADFTNIKPTLATMRYEAMFQRKGIFLTNGATLLTRNAFPPSGTSDVSNPMAAGSSRWVPNTGFVSGTGYTSAAAAGTMDNALAITGQHGAGINYRWDNGSPVTETFVAYDTNSVALTPNDGVACFAVSDDQTGFTQPRWTIDDVAYLWY